MADKHPAIAKRIRSKENTLPSSKDAYTKQVGPGTGKIKTYSEGDLTAAHRKHREGSKS